ncbi:MAG TPA: hypothetical protein VLF20_05215 [Patescibacteria group bacterium]|nr:hypothetical protein [Patescibacteria group bacterium]
MKKKLFLVLLLIFLAHFGFRVFEYREVYLSGYDPDYWQKRYELSQWSPIEGCRNLDPHVNPETCQWDDAWYAENKDTDEEVLKKNPLGDDGLYTYAGWQYIHGADPTLLNAEIPPLGKYLIGLSILLFGNQNIFALVSGIFVLCAFFVLNKYILKDNLLAFLPVALLSFDPLFYTQLRAPFLDLLYLGFLVMTFYFFLKEKFFLAALFLGMMMATKSSISTLVIVSITMGSFLLYMKHTDQIKKFMLSLSVSVLVFLVTYSVYFFKGHSLIEFLKVQKWIFHFYANGTRGDPSAPFQMLLMGNFPTWWGETLRVPEWSVLWTIGLLCSVYYIYRVFRKRSLYPSVLLGIWVVVYLLFLAAIPTWPRYLLLVLPFMYTLCVWVLTKSKVFKGSQ